MDESVLMICDGKKSIGIAGIHGWRKTLMITDDVQDNVNSKQLALMEPTSVNQARRSTSYRCIR